MMYKRFLIPLKGGRCLVEKLQNGGARVSLAMRGLARRPLDLWLFDETNAYRFPQKLYPDKSGNMLYRQDVRDMGLETVTYACLLDEELQPVAEGGKNTDWRSIMLNAGSVQTKTQTETEETAEENCPETAETAAAEDAEREIKNEVKKLVSELDEQLRPQPQKPCTKPPLPCELDWQDIDLKQLAANKRLWKYARNPFVTSHCRDKGLLLAENDKFYFLGVPCDKADRFSGCSQGFRIFTDKDGKGFCILKCEK